MRHAAAERTASDAIVVRVETVHGHSGFGETLAREYVTGETAATVLGAIRDVYLPFLTTFRARSFADAFEAIDALPWVTREGHPCSAARAAVELSLLDLTLRIFARDMESLVGWLDLPGFGKPGSLDRIRFSGVLASEDLSRTMRQLRLMYWSGLRHFKLKVGFPEDAQTVRAVARYLGSVLRDGRATLRVDANGAWTAASAHDWLQGMRDVPLVAVEQPLSPADDSKLVPLVDDGLLSGTVGRVGRTRLPGSAPEAPIVVLDESLRTLDDAQTLVEAGIGGGFNIRIAKCGGLIPSLRLAAFARREGVQIQLGCMVGETSLLSAAAIRFLEVCPGVRWAEGCFGKLLLRDEIVARPLRFGFGGRPPKPNSGGLGPTPDPRNLDRLCISTPVLYQL